MDVLNHHQCWNHIVQQAGIKSLVGDGYGQGACISWMGVDMLVSLGTGH